MAIEPCQRCGEESAHNHCAADGRTHWHGRVHTTAGGLDRLCEVCAYEADREWDAWRDMPDVG